VCGLDSASAASEKLRGDLARKRGGSLSIAT
jgi:hypothetical protein